MDAIRQEIINLRNRLLDLGNDNPLINYRRRDDRSLTISDRDAGVIFDHLVVGERSLRVLSSKEGREDGTEALRAPYSSGDIVSRLQRLAAMSQEAMDEQGYPNLFLVMGLLAWSDGGSRRFRSPVLLLPVALHPVEGSWQLRWSGHDILVSPTLVERMKELGLSIPELADPQDGAAIRRHQAELREALRNREGFEFVNSQLLDCFSFTKSVLYQDLDPANWSMDNVDSHPLLKAILRPESVPDLNSQRERVHAGDFCILDADSSQMKVLEDVVRGQSVVVEGPPGTGKSQTIANIICESLGRGRKVLFVSEKMAALEVVKARLDRAGLSPYVLDLHSERSNRKALIKELDRCLSLTPEDLKPELPDPRLKQLEEELDGYVKSISEPMGNRGLNPYEMVGQREAILHRYASRNRVPVSVGVKDPDFIDRERWVSIMNDLQVLQELLPSLLPLRSNPWRDCELPDLPPDGERLVGEAIRSNLRQLDDLQDSARSLSRSMGMETPLGLGDVYSFCLEVQELLEAGSIGMSNLLDDRLTDYQELISDVLETLQQLQESRDLLLGQYSPSLFEMDAAQPLEQFERHAHSRLRSLRRRFRQAREALLSHSKGEGQEDDEVLLEHLRILHEYQVTEARLAKSESEASRFFGPVWKGVDSDLPSLQRSFDWATRLKENLRSGRYTDATLIAVSRAGDDPSLKKKLQGLESKLEKLTQGLSDLTDMLGSDGNSLFLPGKEGLRPYHIRNRLREMEGGMAIMNRWAQYRRLMRGLSGGPAEPLRGMVELESLHPSDIASAFELGYLEGMLRIAGDVRPAWRSFSAEQQEVRRREFSELDQASLARNRDRLLHVLQTVARGAQEHHMPMRTLKGEINRSRGNLPVRRLISEAAEAIQDLKPCFMMSPLSVAQFLDHRNVHFDLVIFDEASQLLPEESMGALLRSRQAVVMGDSHQLPPSVFFEAQGSSGNDAANLADLESLLGICRTAFPVRRLQWHYRSRHQSLMEVPNMLFYDHRLLIPPSPLMDREGVGLQLRHLRSTVYDRGGSGTNVKEAQRIAREVRAHYRDRPQMSLAVATFSLRQKEAVEVEVAKQRRRHPDLAARMAVDGKEPFMVRNLENLQGDERDVIFVSMGYGFDADGRLSLSFGPLNREGGERRLNVLMTRARHSCVIFSNFRSSDMRIKPDTPLGVRHLQTFLQYAESKRMFLEEFEPSTDPLVNAVADFLRSRGAAVDVNIGNPGYRIDIAVRSPDGARHLVAVLLDGPSYQGMARARDRERLWEAMLQNLGWTTVRVWCQDWHVDPEGARSRLWKRVDAILHSYAPPSSEKVSSPMEENGEDEEGPASQESMLLDTLQAWGPLHPEVLAQEYRQRRGRSRLTPTLRREFDVVVQDLRDKGQIRLEQGFLLLPSQDIGNEIPDLDRREWRPEWVPPWQYAKVIREAFPTDEANPEEILGEVAVKLRLKKGKLLRAHLERL